MDTISCYLSELLLLVFLKILRIDTQLDPILFFLDENPLKITKWMEIGRLPEKRLKKKQTRTFYHMFQFKHRTIKAYMNLVTMVCFLGVEHFVCHL